MPNTFVSAAGGALPAWLPGPRDASQTGLRTATFQLDGLRADVERELAEHARCRRDVEALIERLINGLDDVDAVYEDREDFDEGDTLDAGEAVRPKARCRSRPTKSMRSRSRETNPAARSAS